MKITAESSMARFSEKFKISREFTEKCRKKVPNGYSRQTFNYGPHAIFVDHGDGAYIYTIDGHKLLDLNNNFSVSILGHNNPAINNAIKDVLPKGFSLGNPMKYESKLAEIICSRIESVEKVKFSCSASESCISAARIARGYTGKTKIAKMEGGYHGFIEDLCVSAHPDPSMAGPDDRPVPMADSGGINSYIVENTIILPQNDLAACEKILRENAADIACLFMELQSGAGGIVVLDQEFVKGIRALTEELGIVLIFDETITLRINYHGMQSLYGVKPDLTIMGKIIGGGLPLGAVGGKAEILEVLEKGIVGISGTHHGNNLAAAAGIACLEVMDEAAYDRLNGLAKRIKDELNAWSNRKNYPFMVYGEGSYIAYAFTDKNGRQITTHRDFWRYANNDAILIFALEAATRGFFPVHRGQLALSTPMTDEDIDSFIATTKEIVDGILKN
ncbi:aspartate aminotransferase family protein [Desulfoscipio gibsoniae]|uniref:Glutamate-1-semialdehyde aminotransferase n=1 Tax=Desulfoscipio gibsoniae DSM 7213 TaxID=767817 RepID=R4KRR5_9FIRM|nr:aminotransferase class III-fold pyridoxal phosphate-dependent enzyme [Desulfoscipio gibsoniae]AGL02296.1 glutamate-1-semialdehyde aminotransferase [Desulfoscipio gibsoniae DSM 7213]